MRDTRFPPGPMIRAVDDLGNSGIQRESVLRLADARVVIADYPLLQHDFPQLREAFLLRTHPELCHLDGGVRQDAIRQIIDGWLLQSAAFISENQAGQSEVNSAIETTADEGTAYRPPRYGRASVVSVRDNHRALPPESRARWEHEPDALLDLKGIGVPPTAKPCFADHADGLLYLASALVDLAFQWIIDEVFRHADANFWSVPVYGVLDLGFDAVLPGIGSFAAGMQLRRAHRRPIYGGNLPKSHSPEQAVTWEIEMLLRRYGITSCTAVTAIELNNESGRLQITYARQPLTFYDDGQLRAIQQLTGIGRERVYFDGINIQLTREVGLEPSYAQLVDFGHFLVYDRFQHPVVSRVYDRLLPWGDVIEPDDAGYVQPDPALCLPLEYCGALPTRANYTEELQHRTALDALGFELARKFRANEVTREEVEARLVTRVDEIVSRWSSFVEPAPATIAKGDS